MPAAFVRLDGRCIAVNRLLAGGLGQGLKAGCLLQEFVAPDTWQRFQRIFAAVGTGAPVDAEGHLFEVSGDKFATGVSCSSVFLEPDMPQVILMQFHMAERERPEAPEIALPLAGVLKHFPDDLMLIGEDEPLAETLLRLERLTSGKIFEGELAARLQACRGGASSALYVKMAEPGEAEGHSAEIRFLRAVEGVGAPQSIMAVVRKNIESPEEAAENRRLAYADPLTGLANRRALLQELQANIRGTGKGTRKDLAVFCIDLDEFKRINDLAGHAVGDEMLCLVAGCLQECFSPEGVVGRLGGDEFAGLIWVEETTQAKKIGEAICETIRHIRLEAGERVFTIGCSIGVCCFRPDPLQAEPNATELLDMADRACLRGKRGNGSTVHLEVFDNTTSSSGSRQPLGEQPDMLDLVMRDLQLRAAPIANLRDTRQSGTEVSIHLCGDRAAAYPGKTLIASAERAGYMPQIDTWVLDQVLDSMAGLSRRSWLAVTVSAGSVGDALLLDLLRNRLSSSPLLAGRLCLQISEKNYLREPGKTEAFIRFVSELGCQTAIDDFSGHWPVLARLTSVKVDWIKLSPALTERASASKRQQIVLKGLIESSRELGIQIIAKNVNTLSDLETLEKMNIDAVQGQHIGAAEPWPGSVGG
jgi:diguanylate cyclase (GGDEF)-like protein